MERGPSPTAPCWALRGSVGGAKADAADVARGPVLAVGRHSDLPRAVRRPGPHRQGGANPPGVQEQHDPASRLLIRSACGDSARALGTGGRATLRQRRGRASRRRRAGVTEQLGAEMFSIPLIFGGQVVVEAPGLRPQPVQRIVDLHARRAHPLLPTRLPAAWAAIVAGSRRPRTSSPPTARRTRLRGRDVTRSTEPARASSGAAAGYGGRAPLAARLSLAGAAWSRPLRCAGRPAPARDWRRASWARQRPAFWRGATRLNSRTRPIECLKLR